VNAGLLAVRILSGSIPRLLSAMDEYMKAQEREVLAKVDTLEAVGWEDYKS
jgi:phosphoribosylaminoimidazole carboxylase